MEIQYLITYFTTMLAITNPLGNAGIFISMTSSLPLKEQRYTAFKTAVASLIILTVVTLCGREILDAFGIQIYAFHLAGGLIILTMGMHMLQSKADSVHTNQDDVKEAATKDSVAVVPMALPLIAGPGAMTSVIVYASKMPTIEGKLALSVVNLLLMVIVFVLLFFSSYVKNILGDSGIRVVTKVMGMILVAMAFMMIGDGLGGMVSGILTDLVSDGAIGLLKSS